MPVHSREIRYRPFQSTAPRALSRCVRHGTLQTRAPRAPASQMCLVEYVNRDGVTINQRYVQAKSVKQIVALLREHDVQFKRGRRAGFVVHAVSRKEAVSPERLLDAIEHVKRKHARH